MTKEQYELILRRIYILTCVYTVFIAVNALKMIFKNPSGNAVPFGLNLVNNSISIINFLCLLYTIRTKLKYLIEGKAELIESFYNDVKRGNYDFEGLLLSLNKNCMTKELRYRRVKTLFFVQAFSILISSTYMLINKNEYIIKNDIMFLIIVFIVSLLTTALVIKTEKDENKFINGIATGVNISILGVDNPVDVLEVNNEKVKAN